MPPVGFVGSFKDEERLDQCVRKAEQKQGKQVLSQLEESEWRENSERILVITKKPCSVG